MDAVRSLLLLLAAGAAVAAALSLGGAASDGLDMLTHLTPFWLAGGLVALAGHLAIDTPRERATLWLALAAIAIAGALMTSEALGFVGETRVAPARQTLKVIQFNLWSHNLDPVGAARWIADQNADIVVLEEVIDNAAPVPTLLAHLYPYQTEAAAPMEHTTVILSKTAPTEAGIDPSPDTKGHHSAAWARFGQGADAFSVVGAHSLWPAPPGPQQAQVRRLAALMDRFDRRSLIVAGDFNTTPWSFSIHRQDALFGVRRRSRFLFSWPVRPYSRHKLATPFPLMPIDHIYAGEAWRTVSVRLGPRLGSDHLPVIAVLTR